MLLNLLGCVFSALNYFGVITLDKIFISSIIAAFFATGMVEIGICVKKGGIKAVVEGVLGALIIGANIFFVVKMFF